MKLHIASADHDRAILVCDEAMNDVAEFYHSDHATVGQSYETALSYANRLIRHDALVKALEPLANIAQARDFDCEEPISDDDVVLTVPGYVGLKITMGDCRRALALSSNEGGGAR